MNILKIKIKAFTIMEVVFTILLSLLLFSILYFSHTIIRGHVERSGKDFTEVLFLKQRLGKLFDESTHISSSNENLEFHTIDGVSNLEFSDNCLLARNNNQIDTLFKGNYSYWLHQDDELELIDEVLLRLQLHETSDTIFLCLRKKYLPSVTLRRKEIYFDY